MLLSVSLSNLTRVVNDVLEFSRTVYGILEIKREEFELIPTLENVFKQYEGVCRKKNLKFSKIYDSDLPAVIYSDSYRLGQILNKLLDNAIKFTDSGSVEILIGLDKDNSQEKSYGHFIVRDTGIGIKQEFQSEIFDSFNQADSSDTREHGGSGLGLSISSRLVSLLGGRIWVESTTGAGSEFHFTILFPKAKVKKKVNSEGVDSKSSAANLAQGTALHVLLVEDISINQKVMVSLLKKLGHTADVAINGIEAISMLGLSDYDLVLMDIHMPQMDGLEATERIREMEMNADKGDRIPIIALTALAMSGDKETCLKAGMDDYISKPVSKAVLEEKLQQFC